MKHELNFITIDGRYYGGDQNWHPTNRWMRLGGCSAVCACEICAYLAKEFSDQTSLYPYDANHITKEEFLKFFETMFQYIYPGLTGLTRIEKFVQMFEHYVSSQTQTSVMIRSLGGEHSVREAEEFIRASIDAKIPLAYLLLSHKDRAFNEYEWHWFTVTGYEESEQGFYVIFATWGRKHRFLLEEAWDTGKKKRGGLVAVR